MACTIMGVPRNTSIYTFSSPESTLRGTRLYHGSRGATGMVRKMATSRPMTKPITVPVMATSSVTPTPLKNSVPYLSRIKPTQPKKVVGNADMRATPLVTVKSRHAKGNAPDAARSPVRITG